jgi:hypothetical protein
MVAAGVLVEVALGVGLAALSALTNLWPQSGLGQTSLVGPTKNLHAGHCFLPVPGVCWIKTPALVFETQAVSLLVDWCPSIVFLSLVLMVVGLWCGLSLSGLKVPIEKDYQKIENLQIDSEGVLRRALQAIESTLRFFHYYQLPCQLLLVSLC